MPLCIFWIVLWEILGKPWLPTDGTVLVNNRTRRHFGREQNTELCMTAGEPGACAFTVQALPWGKKSTEKNPWHKLNQEILTHFRKKRCSTSYRKNFIIHQHHFLFQWLLGGWRFPEQPTFFLCLGHAVYPEGKNRQKRLRKLDLFFKAYLVCLNHERRFQCTEILTVSHKL